MTRRRIGQSFHSAAADAMAKAAIRQYGPAHLKRGGAIGRAHGQIAKGSSIDQAARYVARVMGKGHAAELRQASEQCIDAGLRQAAVVSRPNPIANDTDVDVEMMLGTRRVAGAQIGVGTVPYLRQKARRSRADQVVVNVEAREQLRVLDPAAYARTTAQVQHSETSAGPLIAGVAEQDAAEILTDALTASRLSSWFTVGIAGSAGVEAGLTSFGRSLLFGVVHRMANGQPIDQSVVTDALDMGLDAFAKTAAQTFVITSDFLEKAGVLFDSQLLRSVSGKIVLAGAVAEVVISTARDLFAYSRGEIDFYEVMRRTLMSAIATGGGVGGYMLAMKLTAGAPPWVRVLSIIALTWGGAWLAEQLGKALLAPVPSSPTLAPT
jgi:hypothetical protein